MQKIKIYQTPKLSEVPQDISTLFHSEKALRMKYKPSILKLKRKFQNLEEQRLIDALQICNFDLKVAIDLIKYIGVDVFDEIHFQLSCNNNLQQLQIYIDKMNEEKKLKIKLNEENDQKKHCIQSIDSLSLVYIFHFLDSVALIKIGQCNKLMFEMSQNDIFYKKFCQKLFPKHMNLKVEDQSLYEKTKQDFYETRYEHKQSLLDLVFSDIRLLIFGNDYIDKYKFDKKAFKLFSTYKQIQQQAHRINLKGVYIRREKYLKVGERPVEKDRYETIKCVFYRYIRFMPNGQVVMIIDVKILDDKQIEDYFLKAEKGIGISDKKGNKIEITRGEWLSQGDQVNVKLLSGVSNITNLEMTIRHSDFEQNHFLYINEFYQKQIGQTFMRQIYNRDYDRAELHKVFTFKKLSTFDSFPSLMEYQGYSLY